MLKMFNHLNEKNKIEREIKFDNMLGKQQNLKTQIQGQVITKELSLMIAPSSLTINRSPWLKENETDFFSSFPFAASKHFL